MAVQELLWARRSRLHWAVFLLTAASMAYFFSQLRSGMTGIVPTADTSLLLSGGAPQIYQYRALTPWLVNLVLGITSELSPQTVLTPETVFQAVELVSIFLLLLVFRHYVISVIGDSSLGWVLSLTLFSALLFTHVIPRASPMAYVFWYSWDIPSVMFFALGLLLLYRRNWIWYYIVFAVASLNRETTAFLALVYLFTAIGKSSPRTVGWHCLAQVLIWVGIKAFLFMLYGDNVHLENQASLTAVGMIDYQHWTQRNISQIMKPENYVFFLSVAGFTIVPTLLLWRSMLVDDFIRRSLLITAPFLAICIWVGIIDEVRIFGELVPIYVIAFLYIISEGLRRENVA